MEWNEDKSKTLPYKGKHVDKDEDVRNTNSAAIVNGHYSSMNKLQNNDKRIGGNIYSFATNKQIAKRLTTPKLTKHNDAAYYPNIQCLLCREWVCSRNR